MARVEFTRFGLKHDYRGAHVAWSIGERNYLGTVIDACRNETPSVAMFKVRHFNGEDAPDVAASVVEVLERDYEAVR